MPNRRPIAKISKARKVRDKAYVSVKRIWWRQLWEASETLDPVCSWPLCSWPAEKTPHHLIPRSVRPDLVCEPENFLALCGLHHSHIHNNPKEAYKMGFLGKSTDSLEELKKLRERGVR